MNQPGNGHQPLAAQHKGIRSRQKDPADTRLAGTPLKPGGQPGNGIRAPDLGLLEIALDILKSGHSKWEGQICIKRAEFTLVMGASRGRFQKKRLCFVGRSPDGSCVVHGLPPY